MTAYKQPREGVKGIDRDDWLLSLDEAAVAHRDALRAVVYHLWSATLIGNPAPIVRHMYERISHPRVGDLVIETSGIFRFRDDLETRTQALGILLEHRREWWHTDEEWARELAEEPYEDERPTEDAWYVQYGSSAEDVCRWTNCDFITVPIDLDEFRLPVGTRDGNGVTISRDDLVGVLADSGFDLKEVR